MRNHTDLLNLIAKKIKAEKYLEIGVQRPENNFNKIDVPFKTGVDPDPAANATFLGTSDEFFKNNTETFDLVFLDGLHEAYQLKKDLKNTWQVLNPGAVVVIHDCNPEKEEYACIPRGNQKIWTGDVYKTVSVIATPKFTVDFDFGVMVIKNDLPLVIHDHAPMNWEYFDKNRRRLLNLVSVSEAKQIIERWILSTPPAREASATI